MNGRVLGILALIAVIAIAAAVVVSRKSTLSPAPVATNTDESVLIPGLLQKIDSVATVSITDPRASIVLTKDGHGVWHDITHDGYPAKAQSIGQLVLALARQDAGEPKTDDPKLFAEIGVEDPAPGPNGTVIDLQDAAGESVATVILGKKSERVPGGRFVRVVGHSRARQIVLPLSPSPVIREWVEQGFMRIPRDRIQSISIQPVDAPAIEVRRSADDPTVFVVDGFNGEYSKDPMGPMLQLTASIAWLDFENVRKSKGDPSLNEAVTTTFVLQGGGAVSIISWPEGEERWVRVLVEDPTNPPEGEAGAQMVAGMQDLRGVVEGWDFRVAPARYETLRPSLEALTANPAPESAPAPSAQ